MLTSEALPSKTVIAAHLYKSSWAVFVEMALGFSDIDDVRNGLLLWKPIEHAFDTAQLCFTYDTQNNRYDKISNSQSVGSRFFKYRLKWTQHTKVAWLHLSASDAEYCMQIAQHWNDCCHTFRCSFVARVLNSALLTEKLSSYGQRIMGASWAAPSSARAMTLTFADIDKAALSFPLGCEVRPYKRVLCYQAHLAQREAAKQGWTQINFDDFWSEDEPYVAKVQHWLSGQTADAYGE